MFDNVFPKTASGKVELASSYLDQKYGQRLPTLPALRDAVPAAAHLAGLGPSASPPRSAACPASDGVPPLEMHPDDARARGLARRHAGQGVERAGRGAPAARASPTRCGRAWCASLKGAWFKTSDNGQTVSALAPGHHADLAGGACYNDARVEVAAYPSL